MDQKSRGNDLRTPIREPETVFLVRRSTAVRKCFGGMDPAVFLGFRFIEKRVIE
jgi:hypothetical protein